MSNNYTPKEGGKYIIMYYDWTPKVQTVQILKISPNKKAWLVKWTDGGDAFWIESDMARIIDLHPDA